MTNPVSAPGSGWKSGGKLLLKITISALIIAFLLRMVHPEQLQQTIHAISVWELLLLVLFYLFCQFLSTVRWRFLANSMGLAKGSVGSLSRYYHDYLVGMFFNLFLPTSVGGDFGRATLLARREQAPWTQAMASVFAERLSGLIGLLGYVVLALLALKGQALQWMLLLTVATLLLGALGFAFCFRWVDRHPWGEALIRRIFKAPAENTDTSFSRDAGHFWPSRTATFMGLVISFLFHGFSIAVQLLLIRQLGGETGFWVMAVAYGLSGLASLLPVSLSGIGVREGATTALLMSFGHVAQPVATVFSLVWLSVMLLANLSGGLLLLGRQFRKVI